MGYHNTNPRMLNNSLDRTQRTTSIAFSQKYFLQLAPLTQKNIPTADNVTVFLSAEAFKDPKSFSLLRNISADGIRQIEEFLQTGRHNVFGIKVL